MSNYLKAIEAVAAMLTIISLILISEGIGAGFLVGMVSAGFWLVVGWGAGLQALIMLQLVLFFVNLNGYLN